MKLNEEEKNENFTHSIEIILKREREREINFIFNARHQKSRFFWYLSLQNYSILFTINWSSFLVLSNTLFKKEGILKFNLIQK